MILDEIAKKTLERIEIEKRNISLEYMKSKTLELENKKDFLFEEALKRPGINYICEVKKASPSKGIIDPIFPYVDIAREYEEAGAAAISVLTEPFYFKGSDSYLREIAKVVNIPLIRKDFTVDEYMIYQAKELGASACLLICAILSQDQLEEYLGIANEIGISALVEAHDEEEVTMALKAKARIIGVNNRNLKDFTVDINNSINLRKMIPDEIIYVSESGIKTSDDIAKLKENKTNAVLIGETLMLSPNKKQELEKLNNI